MVDENVKDSGESVPATESEVERCTACGCTDDDACEINDCEGGLRHCQMTPSGRCSKCEEATDRPTYPIPMGPRLPPDPCPVCGRSDDHTGCWAWGEYGQEDYEEATDDVG